MSNSPAVLARWEQIGRELADPSIELTPEEFAVFLSVFRELQKTGAAFDAAIIALVDCLARQMEDTLEDSDRDDTDYGLEPVEDVWA